jgi:hypothetical protein
MLPRVEVKRDDGCVRDARRWRRGGSSIVLVVITAVHLLACRNAPVPDAGTRRSSDRALPVDLGVGSGVAIVSRGTSTEVFARGDSVDRASSGEDLVDVVTLLAAFRTHVVDERGVHHCNGLNCSHVHGDVTPARALAVGCLHFFDDLATRVGPDSLAAAFLTLGVTPPAIPSERDARVRLAARGEGWMLSPRDALGLARGLRDRPAPWSDVLDEGLRPESPAAAGVRGKTGGSGEMSGWFVGYAESADRPLVAVRVARCIESCTDRAVVVAQWALRQRAPR